MLRQALHGPGFFLFVFVTTRSPSTVVWLMWALSHIALLCMRSPLQNELSCLPNPSFPSPFFSTVSFNFQMKYCEGLVGGNKVLTATSGRCQILHFISSLSQHCDLHSDKDRSDIQIKRWMGGRGVQLSEFQIGLIKVMQCLQPYPVKKGESWYRCI